MPPGLVDLTCGSELGTTTQSLLFLSPCVSGLLSGRLTLAPLREDLVGKLAQPALLLFLAGR
jgi:hypothetical protein